MAKNDNAHSVRLADSLERNVGVDTAREFEEKFPLSKSAIIEKNINGRKQFAIIWKDILIQIR